MKPYFIGEIGVNHNGDLKRALSLIDEVVECGADVAKFQYYDPVKLLGRDSPYFEYASQCQITKSDHEGLAQYCEAKGIEYAVSVFDEKDLEWAASISSFIKIASRMNKDSRFLSKAVNLGKPVIMSLQEEPRVPIILDNLSFMYCVTEYPAKPNKYLTFKGYSDQMGLSSHCPDPTVSIYGALKGARVFENHITLDRSGSGCDHTSSLEPLAYGYMIKEIRSVCGE